MMPVVEVFIRSSRWWMAVNNADDIRRNFQQFILDEVKISNVSVNKITWVQFN